MDDEDDLDWEEWLDLSDEQQEAILERELSDYDRWYARLSTAEKIAHHRKNTIDHLKRCRRIIRKFDFHYLRDHVQRAQIRLVKLRVWRATGIYPGSG